MNSLQRIQKIVKIIYVITVISFVCSIISLVSSIIGAIFIGVWGLDTNVINYFASIGLPINYNRTLCLCTCSAVQSTFILILLYFAKRFYKQELQQGNPFDKPVVKSMRKLGILHILLPLASTLVIIIINICFGVKDFGMLSLSYITLGIVYLVVSYILEYGSELKRR